MHREQRHLDRERHGEGQEDQAPRRYRQHLCLCDRLQVEGQRTVYRVRMEHRRGYQPNEHQGRAEHGVDEELRRGVLPTPVTPLGNEEVHGHEHDLEKNEEQEQVERHEHAHAAGLQQQ